MPAEGFFPLSRIRTLFGGIRYLGLSHTDSVSVWCESIRARGFDYEVIVTYILAHILIKAVADSLPYTGRNIVRQSNR